MTKTVITVFITVLAISFMAPHSSARQNRIDQNTLTQNMDGSGDHVSGILDKLKKRYGGESFSADFYQESTLAALGISDTARGRAWFRHPGKMRWEYHSPDRHAIITDGDTLWIYRPEENQVIKGDAAAYFGDGKGAGFLANFDLVTESFDVTLAGGTETHWRMKLVPHEIHYELSSIYLFIDKETSEIDRVVSKNLYGDTTAISFENPDFDDDPAASHFEFEIPVGADVILMD